ncbi:hypothetical protein WJX72_005805 [[Myrmecia] bisecta]|uniref:Uncharacterized protein n=1 Tax=[Myrmecia] bisecta TaxID=41462 RepID=A0AAW1QQV6_9CHLO
MRAALGRGGSRPLASGSDTMLLSADLDGPPPALEAVFASRIAKAAMALEGATPSRLNREGAARTYHMYCYWGYMNRRMARLRQQEEASGVAPTSGPYAFGDASGVQSSSYGSMTNVWRYFENVPDAITSLRTGVAAAVADRHLRALFGDQEECITTLLAWQQMCHEARWFGRALYDAEEFVLQSSLDPGL